MRESNRKYYRTAVAIAGIFFIFLAGLWVGNKKIPSTPLKEGDRITVTYPFGEKVMGANNTGVAQQPMKTVNLYIYRTAQTPKDMPADKQIWIFKKDEQVYFLTTVE